MITVEYLKHKALENRKEWDLAMLTKTGLSLIVEKARLTGQMELLSQLVKDAITDEINRK